VIVKNACALCKFFYLHSFQSTVSPHVRRVPRMDYSDDRLGG
jgi:hypothetical protein